MGLATDAIHAGQEPDPTNGAVMVPIYATSTYAQTDQEGEPGECRFDYARTINPTRLALEANLAALEGGKYGRCFGSGMAAVDVVVRTLNAGDHVICGSNVYGGTFRLFDKVLAKHGISFSFVDTSDIGAVCAALRDETRMVHIETPTNPMMTLSDIKAVAEVAHGAGAKLIVDNTFASPVFQQPLSLGADVVVHSTTKYLNGHSDSVGGVVVTNDPDFDEEVAFLQNSAGAVMSPFEAFLIMRGTKTLVVRMKEHDRSGRVIADFLKDHPKVERVYYPGHEDHPQHALAKTQMTGFGGMISFVVNDGLAGARRFLGALRVCALAESLGGVESLVSHPGTMTHGSVPEADRAKLGIADGLVRVSVGLEDVEDIQADLDQALAAI